MTTIAEDYEAGKVWNENRAKREKAGIENFWRQREVNKEFSKMQELGWTEYNNQKK